MAAILSDKFIFSIRGKDSYKFLQGLITNDIYALKDNGILYSLMLTPQGRYYAEIFLYHDEEKIFVEVPLLRKEEIMRKFLIYKLRSDVYFAEEEYRVFWSKENEVNKNSFYDPRTKNMGFRSLVPPKFNDSQEQINYDYLRISCFLPEGEKDLLSRISFPLEYGLDNFNAFSFTKGCYVGQELTARTHHTGVIRKEVVQIVAENNLPTSGTDLIIEGEKIGIYGSNVGKFGLALIKKEKRAYLEKDKFINIEDNAISFKFKETV